MGAGRHPRLRLQAHELGGQQQSGWEDARAPALQGMCAVCAVRAGSGWKKAAHAAQQCGQQGTQGQKDQCPLPEEQALLQPVMIKLAGGPLLNAPARSRSRGKAKHQIVSPFGLRTAGLFPARESEPREKLLSLSAREKCRRFCFRSMTGKRHSGYRKPVLRGWRSMLRMSSSDTALLDSRRTRGCGL